MLFESVAFAMGTPQAGGAAPSGGDMLMQFVPLILMFAIFWFLLIRPQQKRAKAHKQMLAELKRGDHVMTSSGLIGRIMEISEEAFLKAQKAMESCERIICTAVPVGSCNKRLGELIDAAKKSGKAEFV